MLTLYFSCSLKKPLIYIKRKDSIVACSDRKECRTLLLILTVFLPPYQKLNHEPKKYALSTEKPALLLTCLTWCSSVSKLISAFISLLTSFSYMIPFSLQFFQCYHPQVSLKLKYQQQKIVCPTSFPPHRHIHFDFIHELIQEVDKGKHASSRGRAANRSSFLGP